MADEDVKIEPNLGSIALHLEYMRRDVNEINRRLGDSYVKKEDFTPVRNLVYGFTGLLLTGVVIALISLVVGHGL